MSDFNSRLLRNSTALRPFWIVACHRHGIDIALACSWQCYQVHTNLYKDKNKKVGKCFLLWSISTNNEFPLFSILNLMYGRKALNGLRTNIYVRLNRTRTSIKRILSHLSPSFWRFHCNRMELRCHPPSFLVDLLALLTPFDEVFHRFNQSGPVKAGFNSLQSFVPA